MGTIVSTESETPAMPSGTPSSPPKLKLSPMKPQPASVDDSILAALLQPKNLGKLEDADVVGVGGNPACGDHIYLYFKFDSEKQQHRVSEAKYMTVGCGFTLAAGSSVTEWIKGKDIAELKGLTDREILKMIGITELPPNKTHCIELVLEATQDAVAKATGTATPNVSLKT